VCRIQPLVFYESLNLLSKCRKCHFRDSRSCFTCPTHNCGEPWLIGYFQGFTVTITIYSKTDLAAKRLNYNGYILQKKGLS
jgi:hypothetical protein